MRWTAGFVALALSLPVPLLADVLLLKDGTRIEGDVTRKDDGWVVTADGKTTAITQDRVRGIELGTSQAGGPQEAARKLSALRKTVENQSDLRQILENYQRFLDVVKDPAALKGARDDMAQWKSKLDKGLVKIGGSWVSPEERDQLAQSAQGDADVARGLLKQGRTQEAEPIVQRALTNDSTNPSALYIRGLISLGHDKFPAARDAFASVAVTVPNHGPTLNNLAVSLWRLKQYPQAMLNYDGAMQASPMNKAVLDNVAAAIHALPDELKNNAAVQRAVRRFKEQDKSLTEEMSHMGWHRWGNTWVNDQEWERLEAQRKETQTKLDAFATDFDATKKEITRLDDNLDQTARTLRRLEADSYFTDQKGQTLRLALPPLYFDLQRDYQRYEQDRVAQVKRLDALQETAKTLQKKMPQPKYSDVQSAIGPEGTPLRPPVLSATSQPTTQAVQAAGAQ